MWDGERPTGRVSAMPKDELLRCVRSIIEALEPRAQVILYGSRARGDARGGSDWDFLILLEGSVDGARTDRIRHRLYELEWESGEVLCSIVLSNQDWNSPERRATPFHAAVEREGIAI